MCLQRCLSSSCSIHHKLSRKLTQTTSSNLVEARTFWTAVQKSSTPLTRSSKLPCAAERAHDGRFLDTTNVWVPKIFQVGSIHFHPRRAVDVPISRRANAFPLRQNSGTDVDDALPVPGSVVFRRTVTSTRIEYHTTLESIGLAKVSSDRSRAVAFSEGYGSSATGTGTPVGIVVHVAKEGGDFRLRGCVKTVVTLCCNRCLSSLVEPVVGDFDLLLSEKPVEQPTEPSIGVILGADNERSPDGFAEAIELDLNLDDKIHFPRNAKELDISKYIHDTIHLEIPMKSLCQISCKGLCLDCGANLNTSSCKCAIRTPKPGWGVLEQLKKQMEDQ